MAWRLFLAAFAVYAALALATGEYLNERDSEARLVAARGAARGDALVLLHPWHKPVLTALAAGVLRLSGDVVALKVLQGALAVHQLGARLKPDQFCAVVLGGVLRIDDGTGHVDSDAAH